MNDGNKKKIYMFLNILCLLMIIITIIYMIIVWDNIVNEIPTHIGFDGNVNETGDKETVIILPIINIIIFTMISVIEKFPEMWNIPVTVTEENKEKIYSITKNMLVGVKFVLTTMFSGMVISIINEAKYVGIISIVCALIMFAMIAFGIIRIVKCK